MGSYKKVYCFGIKYTNREGIISITGPTALEGFVREGFVNMYNGESAPTELEVDVKLKDDYLEDILETEHIIKKTLEDEVGLTIKSFKFKIIN